MGLLDDTMAAAIPLHINVLRQRGGPTPEEFEEARPMGMELAQKGDLLLYGSSVAGETADLFNRLAKAIAVLSFLPGGIIAFRMHWNGNARPRDAVLPPKAPVAVPKKKREPRSPLPPEREPEQPPEVKAVEAKDLLSDINEAIKKDSRPT